MAKSVLAFERPTLELLESIPPSTVDSWDKLWTALLEWYLPLNIAQILDVELQTLRRGEGEPLMTYLNRFARTIRWRMEFGKVEERIEGDEKVDRKRLESQYLTSFVQGPMNEGFNQKLFTTYPLSLEVVTMRIRQEDEARSLFDASYRGRGEHQWNRTGDETAGLEGALD